MAPTSYMNQHSVAPNQPSIKIRAFQAEREAPLEAHRVCSLGMFGPIRASKTAKADHTMPCIKIISPAPKSDPFKKDVKVSKFSHTRRHHIASPSSSPLSLSKLLIRRQHPCLHPADNLQRSKQYNTRTNLLAPALEGHEIQKHGLCGTKCVSHTYYMTLRSINKS